MNTDATDYRSGVAARRLHDPTRRHWDGDGARPIPCSLWYPTDADGAIEPTGMVARTPFVPEAVIPEAPLAEARARWPLVLLSHGTGGAAGGLGWLARRLAERGHVCVGVDHHGNTATEPYRAEGFACWWERATDLSRVLDALDAAEALAPLAGRIDRERVATVGFSLGGYTALALAGAITSLTRFETWRRENAPASGGPRECPDLAERLPHLERSSAAFRVSRSRHGDDFADDRIGAFVALAPAPTVRGFTPESVAAIERPVLIAGGEADEEAPFETCARWLATLNPRFALTSLGPEIGHYVFLPECTGHGRTAEPALCTDAPGVDRGLVHERVAREIAAFLARALR